MHSIPRVLVSIPLLLFVYSVQAVPIDRAKFFGACKAHVPAIASADSLNAVNSIIDYWESKGYEDRRALAYVLGTALRETAGTMRPVREGLCKTDECSIAAVTKLLKEKGIADNYAKPDSYGRSYFGRGYVQLTHAQNYKKLGEALGWGSALYEKPGLALNQDKAIEILVEGMYRGLFTGKKLNDFFLDTKEDWIGARKIVNPGSKRAEITAKHSQKFFACLRGT